MPIRKTAVSRWPVAESVTKLFKKILNTGISK